MSRNEKKRSNKIQDSGRMLKNAKKIQGVIKENNDGVYEEKTEECMDRAVEMIEKNYENFKQNSSPETLREVDRNQVWWFVMGGIPHAVTKKDLEEFLNVICSKLKVPNLKYIPIKSRRSLVLQADSADDMDWMIEKLKAFSYFKKYGERSIIGQEVTDEFAEQLIMAEDGPKTPSSYTLFNYQSLSFTAFRNLVWG